MTTESDILVELSPTNTEMKNSLEKHKNSENLRIMTLDSSLWFIHEINKIHELKKMKLKAMNLKDACSLEGYDKTR